MWKFLFGITFFCVASLLAWIAFTRPDFCLICGFQADSSSIGSNPFQTALINDLKLATQNKELPDSWGQIKEVRYLYHSKRIQKILNNTPFVSTNKNGDKKLLIEFFDEPGSTQFVLIRYSILDIATEKTVSEVNRRLKFMSGARP